MPQVRLQAMDRAMSSAVTDIWTRIALIQQLMQGVAKERSDAIVSEFARETPELSDILSAFQTCPLLNYVPFDILEGTLPSGDPKSSPMAFHQDPSKQRIVVTGNRCSKTYSGCAEVLSACIGIDPVTKGPSSRFAPPLQVWVVSDTEDTSVQIVQKVYHELCPKYLLHPSCDYNERTGWKNNVIQFRHPFNSIVRFRFSSQGASTFQGTKQDIIHLDEEQPEDVDDECVARTAGVGGPPGEIIRTFTPIYRENVGISWIHSKLYSRRTEIPALTFHFWTLFDVPDWIIPQEEKERIVASYDEDNRDTRVFGLFQPSGIRLAFPVSLIREQREHYMSEPLLGHLAEEEYAVEEAVEDVRYSRGNERVVESTWHKRVVFKEEAA